VKFHALYISVLYANERLRLCSGGFTLGKVALVSIVLEHSRAVVVVVHLS
jgi:hypothetical protein